MTQVLRITAIITAAALIVSCNNGESYATPTAKKTSKTHETHDDMTAASKHSAHKAMPDVKSQEVKTTIPFVEIHKGSERKFDVAFTTGSCEYVEFVAKDASAATLRLYRISLSTDEKANGEKNNRAPANRLKMMVVTQNGTPIKYLKSQDASFEEVTGTAKPRNWQSTDHEQCHLSIKSMVGEEASQFMLTGSCSNIPEILVQRKSMTSNQKERGEKNEEPSRLSFDLSSNGSDTQGLVLSCSKEQSRSTK